ncbi:TonB-dependent hemoglobin/transferrin/lactoferrin family receptor [Kerstersia sp.]|uniref:TonB-dependent receptor n=1 Tax=Kerstersia sp. TaxID=1930783 RepID=UPI003F8E4074
MRSLLIPLALPLAVSLALLAPVTAEAADTVASTRLVDFDVPAQALDLALKVAAAQAGLSVAADQSLLGGRRSAPLHGSYSVQQGFEHLLAGSGLRVTVSANLVAITPPPASATPATELAPVLVTGNISERAEIFTTPEMLSRVTAEDLRRLPPRNAADALANVSGVYTSQGRADPGVSVNIWGMQDFGRVNVMVDGTRQNFQRSGHGSNGQVYVDPALLASVDVHKGPSSTVGGAGMIAGMVNFRTLEIEDILLPGQQTGGRITSTTGSNAYHFEGSAALGHHFNDDLNIMAVVSRRNIGAFRLGKRNGVPQYNNSPDSIPADEPTKTTWQDAWSGLVKLGWQPSASHHLQLSYMGFDTKFANGGDDDRLSESGSPIDEGRYSVRTDTLKLNYDYRPDNDWIDLSSSLYYTGTRRNEARVVTENNASGAYALKFATHTVGGTLENTALFQYGDWELTARTGGEFFYDWTKPSYNDHVDEASRDPAWYVGPTPEGKRTVASVFQDAVVEYKDWLRLGMGLRLDHFWLSGSGQMYMKTIRNEQGVRPSSTALYTKFEVDRSAYGVAPTLSLALKPVEWLQVFANYGQGLRPPAITETLMYGMHVNNMFPFYPSPGLKEERSRSWQFGANLNFLGVLQSNDSLRAKLAWFDTRVRNYITGTSIMSPVATADCGGWMCPNAYVNLNEPARFRGIDFQVDYESEHIFANLNLTRTLSRLNTRDYNPFPLGSWTGYPDTTLGNGDRDSNGMFDIFASEPPKLKLGVSGGVRLFDSTLELGGRWRYEEPAQEYSQTRKSVRTVRLWDAWASWHATRSLRLSLSVDNLLNENYVELAGSGGGFSYGPGRTVRGTLAWQF